MNKNRRKLLNDEDGSVGWMAIVIILSVLAMGFYMFIGAYLLAIAIFLFVFPRFIFPKAQNISLVIGVILIFIYLLDLSLIHI